MNKRSEHDGSTGRAVHRETISILEKLSDVQENLATILRRAAKQLRGAGLPGELAERMEGLAKQMHQPCLVAVVGRVKVGKSTFVNALLGEDLAKVGTTETTATINYFTFGTPDPERPVRCHWRNGKVTDESRRFLDGLQGNDLETLRQADGIDHLEYFLPNPILKQITLVDTPGTGTMVEEHENRTAEFMQLNSQLRERHDEETRQLGYTADAMIYLVAQVTKGTDREFLEEFTQTTGGRSSALNAIGVLSKIELQPEVMARRHELSAKIASRLKESLNTVVPAAAGLRRELDRLLENDRAGLEQMMTTLRRMPPDTLEMLLDAQEFFCDPEGMFDFDCPVSPTERRELLGDMKWGVFTSIARVAAHTMLDLDGVIKRLEELSGFGPLWEVLNKRFIERGHILRCYRIAGDAQGVLDKIRFTHLPERRKEVRQNRDRLERFINLIRQAGGDPTTTRELEEFVYRHLDVNRLVNELETLHAELNGELGALFYQLLEYNEDFEVLQNLEGSDGDFTEVELGELRPLLGLYGGRVEKRLPPGTANAEYVGWRQMYWGRRKAEAPYGTIQHTVADQAFTRYGLILYEILGANEGEETMAYAIARIEEQQPGQPFYVGQTYVLQASIQIDSEGEVPEGFESAAISLPSRERDMRFDIVVRAEDMEVEPGWIQPYVLGGDKEPRLLEFTLTPTKPGRKRIRVEFLYQRHWLGKIEFEVEAVETKELAVSP